MTINRPSVKHRVRVERRLHKDSRERSFCLVLGDTGERLGPAPAFNPAKRHVAHKREQHQ
jgi:hypothetical protein